MTATWALPRSLERYLNVCLMFLVKKQQQFIAFKTCKNRPNEVKLHTRVKYAYRHGQLGESDCDVTRAISRDRFANKMAAPMHYQNRYFRRFYCLHLSD